MKSLLALVFFCAATSCIAAQGAITTAGEFFKSVSEYYGRIRDYEAALAVSANGVRMDAQVSFKRPNLLRIDFSRPDGQTILFSGDVLTIYLPSYSVVLMQSVSDSDSSQGMNLATPQGLALMSRYYSIAYESSPSAVPLDEGSSEMVVKLVLSRKNTSEGFRQIRLAINPNSKLIRRVDATSIKNERFIFTFSNYSINNGIPDQRFIYDPPSSANIYNNFLFSE